MSDRRRVGVWAAGILGILGIGGGLVWFLPAERPDETGDRVGGRL